MITQNEQKDISAYFTNSDLKDIQNTIVNPRTGKKYSYILIYMVARGLRYNYHILTEMYKKLEKLK